MRVLVTGGAGFVGSHAVTALTNAGTIEVAVFDNLRRVSRRFDDRMVSEFIHGDIRDRDALGVAMRGTDMVIHAAAQSNVVRSVEDPDYCLDVNVKGTYNVLEVAKRQGVRRVVFLSSREVYGDSTLPPVCECAPFAPKNLYGATKVAGEMLCQSAQADGLEVIILRLSNLYGSGDCGRVIPNFIANALTNKPLIVFGGDQTVDFLPVEAAAREIVKAAFGRYFAEPVNIGSGGRCTIIDLANRIIRDTGSSSAIDLRPARQFEVNHFVANVERARRLFGFEPPLDPLCNLAEVVDWYRHDY